MQENEIYDLLDQHGIGTCCHKVFDHNEKMDVDFYPVALKLMSPKVIHKTEVGAVILNIHNKAELQKGKETILANLESHGIKTDECDRFLITAMCQRLSSLS